MLPFERRDDIMQDELRALSESYKRVSGFSLADAAWRLLSASLRAKQSNLRQMRKWRRLLRRASRSSQ
jgi:hypothetical protein